jgi:hypothetical protein
LKIHLIKSFVRFLMRFINDVVQYKLRIIHLRIEKYHILWFGGYCFRFKKSVSCWNLNTSLCISNNLLEILQGIYKPCCLTDIKSLNSVTKFSYKYPSNMDVVF